MEDLNRKVEKLLLEVAPDVEELTGVEINLEDLNVLVTKGLLDNYVKNCISTLCDNAGLDFVEVYKKFTKRKGANLQDLTMKGCDILMGGLYMPQKYTILISERQANKLDDRQLKIIIGHELVHYIQDIVAPEVMNLSMYYLLNLLCEESDMAKSVVYHEKCIRCGSEMVLREGMYGKFWGCSEFAHTGCRGTYNYWYKMDEVIKGDEDEADAIQIEMTAIEGYAAYIEHLLEQKYPVPETSKETYQKSYMSGKAKVIRKILPIRSIFKFGELLQGLFRKKIDQYIWGEGIIKYLIREKNYPSNFKKLLGGIRREVVNVVKVKLFIEMSEFHIVHLGEISIFSQMHEYCQKVEKLIDQKVIIGNDNIQGFISSCEKELPTIFSSSEDIPTNIELATFSEDRGKEEGIFSYGSNFVFEMYHIEDKLGKNCAQLFYYVFLLPISRRLAITCDQVKNSHDVALSLFNEKKREIRELIEIDKVDGENNSNVLSGSLSVFYHLKNQKNASKQHEELLGIAKRLLAIDLKFNFYKNYRTIIRRCAESVTTLKTSPITPLPNGEMFFKFDNLRNCPDCQIHLESNVIENIVTDICPACNIVFLDSGELNKLVNHGDVENDSDTERIPSEVVQDDHAVRQCPSCPDSEMTKTNFLDYSDIVLDYCHTCGGYLLDADEMAKIKDYVGDLQEIVPWQQRVFQSLYQIGRATGAS